MGVIRPPPTLTPHLHRCLLRPAAAARGSDFQAQGTQAGRSHRRGGGTTQHHSGASTPFLLSPAGSEPGCSEQRPLGRDPVTPGKAVRAQFTLAQGAVLETFMDHVCRLQAKLAKRLCWPPCVLSPLARWAGGLRHQQPAAHLEERSRTLGQHGGAPERAGQDPVETRPRAWLPPAHLGSLLQDRDAAPETESLDSPAEEGSPSAVGLEQRQRDLRPVGRHDQAGQAAARTKVNETSPRQARTNGGRWRQSPPRG